MVGSTDLLRTLRLRRHLGRGKLVRGKAPPRPNVSYSSNLGLGCLVLVIAVPLLALALIAAAYALQLAIALAIVLGILLIAAPFRRWVVPAFRGEPLYANAFASTPPAAMATLGAISTGGVTYGFSHEFLPAALAGVVGAVAFRPTVGALDGKRLPRFSAPRFTRADGVSTVSGTATDIPGPFGLWIGEATGTLAAMGHTAGIRRGSNVTLNLRDAAKNIAIFGETGTGKTTRVINHLLIQALDFDCGALIFDVRGDFHDTAERAGRLTGKKIQRIGVGQLGVNLLEGLTPNTAAGFLESAFKLLGQGEGDSGFWVSLAIARCQNALAVLEHVPGRYSLAGLYAYVFDDRRRKEAIVAATDILTDLQVRGVDGDRQADLAARRLKSALDYEATVAAGYTEKERSGVNRTIESALARFTDPELEDAFCSSDGAQARLSDVLDGAVFVVNVPREQFKAAARVVYLFLKERFFQALNARAQMLDGPSKTRPVLFLCDEYQQLASAGDATFFDTSRALNVIGIVASQSVEAYQNAIGSETAAAALLGNFTNIVAFRSTERTMEYVAGKLGEVDVWKQSYSVGKTSAGFLGDVSQNEGRSASEQRQRLLGPQTFRALTPDQAVALLSVDGSAFDDVLLVPQITSDDLG